jgi:hypothetical protein
MALDQVPDFILANFVYYLVAGITLYLWDIIELYIELEQLRFIRDRAFWVYYWVRLFFSIAIFESVFALNLLNVDNKAIISFVTPLIFSTLLQNLVVEVGGGESNINFKEIFDRFKVRIVAHILLPETRKKAQVKMKLYLDDAVQTQLIQDMCQFHGEKEEYSNLLKNIADLSNNEKRKELVTALIKLGGIEAAKNLMNLTDKSPESVSPPR